MSSPTIERAFDEVRAAIEAVDAATRALASAQRRLEQAKQTFMLIHPGNPNSPYAPEARQR